MGAEFGGLNTALSALYAQRRGLEVTGQNVANVNTDGYTRQRVLMTSVGGSVIPAMYAKSDGVGAGVAVSSVQRLQDAFLESRANTEQANLSYLQDQQATLGRIEQAFGEPGPNGLQSMLSAFWNSWDDVATSPDDPAARTQLLGQAQTLVDGFNHSAQLLDAQWTSTREHLISQVQAINTAAANVASLNKAIIAATKAGNNPNDLMDQRDMLVRQVTSMVGGTTRNNDDGSVDIFVGGNPLVTRASADSLYVDGDTALAANGGSPTVSIKWSNGQPAAVTSGSAGSALGALNSTIPSYASGVAAVAQQFASEVNAAHAAGWDLDGAAGGALFGGSGTTADPLTLQITDPRKLAASGQAPTLDGGGNPIPNLDGSNAAKIAALSGGGSDQAYRQFIVGLGSQTQTTDSRVTRQQSVVTQVVSARDSQAGVNIDEEMTNMVAYQQAYNAAARYLTAVDSMLDTLINRTGLVGR